MKALRTVLDFPCEENVKCQFAKAEVVENEYYTAVDIYHRREVPCLIKGKEGKIRVSYFRDRFFTYRKDKPDDLWDLGMFLRAFSLPYEINGLTAIEIANMVKLTLNSSIKESTYYIKTILFEHKNRYYLRRGIFPFVSLDPGKLKYTNAENPEGKFKLLGKTRLDNVKKEIGF